MCMDFDRLNQIFNSVKKKRKKKGQMIKVWLCLRRNCTYEDAHQFSPFLGLICIILIDIGRRNEKVLM